jgi:hypothetical protein
MRTVNGIICVLFVLFVLVQYNDPDFYFWMPVYAVPAAWAGVASWRPACLAGLASRALLALSLLGALLGSAWFWPSEAGFWQRDVWWESETAREGMGMMLVALALAVVSLTAYAARRRGPVSGAQGEKSRLNT